MATITHTVAINAAFLQEIKQDNRELRQLLDQAEAMLSSPWPARTPIHRLVELLGSLRDQLAMHFALEEAYGYFDEALTVEPRLSERAGELREEHQILFLDMCDLVDLAEQQLYGEPAPTKRLLQLALRFDEFHFQLMEHESRETELIQHAFHDDIGVGD